MDRFTHVLVASTFWQRVSSCYQHSEASFCGDLSFHLLWVATKEHDGWVVWQEYASLCEMVPNWVPNGLQMRMSDAPHLLQHWVLAVFWILAILLGVQWYLVICISLVTYDSEPRTIFRVIKTQTVSSNASKSVCGGRHSIEVMS